MQETLVRSLGLEDPLEKGMLLNPVLLPGKFHEQRAWWATVRGLTKSQTQLKPQGG